MKKGFKKTIAIAENFNLLQMLRHYINDYSEFQNIKWCGHWDGLNWSDLSFYCDKKGLEIVKNFCLENNLNVKFS